MRQSQWDLVSVQGDLNIRKELSEHCRAEMRGWIFASPLHRSFIGNRWSQEGNIAIDMGTLVAKRHICSHQHS